MNRDDELLILIKDLVRQIHEASYTEASTHPMLTNARKVSDLSVDLTRYLDERKSL